ncbi:MAG: hypothetical protein IPN94_16775, partial [Sphingobacteriales bacterium]|nr:hypothetical protein [Sphingobacteriales bacterium]
MAGGNDNGNAFNQLGALTAIWLDADKNIYIVDGNTSRVVKWAPGATTGILPAGGLGFGTGLDKLNSPRDIFVDAAGNMLVADYGSHRVVKWTPGATAGILVAGIGGQGSGLNQLEYQQGVAVGPNGDLYVSDFNNDRVLKFNGIVENTYTPTVCGEWTAFVTDNNGCTDLSNDLDLISRWYADADGDGFKDPNNFIDACQPSGFLPSSAINDCDDNNPLINPGADEICGDGIDNDCDGVAQNS